MAGDQECLGCGQKFKQKDASVRCTVCGLWAHKTCSGLTNEFFKCIADQFKSTGRAYWACRSCNTYAEGMNHRLRELEDQSKEAVRIGQNNEKEIKELKQTLERKSEALEKRIEASGDAVWDEMDERETRRKNVVLHGLEESTAAENRKRMEDDRNALNNIFATLDVNISAEDDVEFCRRLGEKGENPRPLVAGFFTEWSKNTLLKKAKLLDSTDLAHISITPDLTKMQRQREAGLYQEADRRNLEDLTEDDLSKNLSWKVRGKRGQRRLVKGADQTTGNQLAPRRGNFRGLVRGRGLEKGRARPPTWIQPARGGAGPQLEGRGRGLRKRGRDPEQETGPQPSKRGNRGQARGRLATGANSVEVGRRPVSSEETEEDEIEIESNISMQEDPGGNNSQEEVEDPLLQGLRLGELSQPQQPC